MALLAFGEFSSQGQLSAPSNIVDTTPPCVVSNILLVLLDLGDEKVLKTPFHAPSFLPFAKYAPGLVESGNDTY
jgi:hypothetical protein